MTLQEQAFINWYDNQPTFGVDYQEIWDAACKWQRDHIKGYFTIYDDTEDSDCVLSFYRYKELFNEYD